MANIQDILKDYKNEKKHIYKAQGAGEIAKNIFQKIGDVVTDSDHFQAAADIFSGKDNDKEKDNAKDKEKDLGGKIKEFGKHEALKDAPGLRNFIGNAGDLASAGGKLLKNGDAAFQENIGVADSIISITDNLGLGAKELTEAHKDKKGIGRIFESLKQVGRMTISLQWEAFKFRRVSYSALDFSYWLKTELAKRRMLQEELGVLYSVKESAKEKPEYLAAMQILSGFDLVDLQKRLLGDKGYSKVDLMRNFRARLNETLSQLINLYDKEENKLTEKEKLILKNNKLLLDFIYTSDKKLDEDRVKCLVLHIEEEHAVRLLEKRNDCIEKRVIAELAERKNDPNFEEFHQTVKNQLQVNQLVEKNIQKFIPPQYQKQVGKLQPLLEQKDLNSYVQALPPKELAQAKKFNTQYKINLGKKVTEGKKSLAAKSFLLVAAGLMTAALIVGFAVGGPAVIAGLVIGAVVCTEVARRLKSDVVNDLKKDSKLLIKKFKEEIKIKKMGKVLNKEIEEQLQNDASKDPTNVQAATYDENTNVHPFFGNVNGVEVVKKLQMKAEGLRDTISELDVVNLDEETYKKIHKEIQALDHQIKNDPSIINNRNKDLAIKISDLKGDIEYLKDNLLIIQENAANNNLKNK